jgi:ribokinase
MSRNGQKLDVLVSGYASIDTVYRACAPPRVGETALLKGAVVSSPRCGGCGPGATLALAREGCRVALLTWLGDDAEGRACLHTWREAGIDPGGVVVAAGQASPRSFLFYDPEGGATCYYHPSESAGLRLDSPGRELLADAGALAVTVGPAALTEALLDARRPDQPLAWNVKADGHAFPPHLRARLLREADVVCLNRGELEFVAAALTPLPPSPIAMGEGGTKAPLPSQWERGWGEGISPSSIQRHTSGIVVVTDGAAGCRVMWPGGSVDVPAEPVQISDPTGAGDAFFGAFVAKWLRGAAPPDAASAAAEHVAAFLRQRAEEAKA